METGSKGPVETSMVFYTNPTRSNRVNRSQNCSTLKSETKNKKPNTTPKTDNSLTLDLSKVFLVYALLRHIFQMTILLYLCQELEISWRVSATFVSPTSKSFASHYRLLPGVSRLFLGFKAMRPFPTDIFASLEAGWLPVLALVAAACARTTAANYLRLAFCMVTICSLVTGLEQVGWEKQSRLSER